MPTSASKLEAIKDGRDKMLLSMALHAARVKTRSREARHKKERQRSYRKVRYKRFKGRRDDFMDEDMRQAEITRRAKSLQWTAKWLKAQDRANAEEGNPRSDDDSENKEDSQS